MFSRKSAGFPDRAGLCCYWEKQSVSIPVLSARPDWPPSAPLLLLFALHLRRTDAPRDMPVTSPCGRDGEVPRARLCVCDLIG